MTRLTWLSFSALDQVFILRMMVYPRTLVRSEPTRSPDPAGKECTASTGLGEPFCAMNDSKNPLGNLPI